MRPKLPPIPDESEGSESIEHLVFMQSGCSPPEHCCLVVSIHNLSVVKDDPETYVGNKAKIVKYGVGYDCKTRPTSRNATTRRRRLVLVLYSGHPANFRAFQSAPA